MIKKNDIFDVSKTWVDSGLDDYGNNNELIQDDIDRISWNVEKILISDYGVIGSIKEQILLNCDIKNSSNIIIFNCFLERYINTKTHFYYDKNNKNVIWIALDEKDLKELISGLFWIILNDKNLLKILWIKEIKDFKEKELNTILDKKNDILNKISKFKQELYIIESWIYRLEDKWLMNLGVEKDRDIIQNSINFEENKLIELDEVILNIEHSISSFNNEINKLKKEEISIVKYDDLYSKLINFKISEYVPEKKPWILMDCEKEIFSDILKKWKKILYPLSLLIGLWAFIEVAVNIPKEDKISMNMNYSKWINYNILDNIPGNIPDNILEDVNKWTLRNISGFEKYFIIWTDTYPLEVIYKGNTLEEDIILNTIKLIFIDFNWVKQESRILHTYCYRKDIDKWIKVIIPDSSSEGQTINLSIKK